MEVLTCFCQTMKIIQYGSFPIARVSSGELIPANTRYQIYELVQCWVSVADAVSALNQHCYLKYNSLLFKIVRDYMAFAKNYYQHHLVNLINLVYRFVFESFIALLFAALGCLFFAVGEKHTHYQNMFYLFFDPDVCI